MYICYICYIYYIYACVCRCQIIYIYKISIVSYHSATCKCLCNSKIDHAGGKAGFVYSLPRIESAMCSHLEIYLRNYIGYYVTSPICALNFLTTSKAAGS